MQINEDDKQYLLNYQNLDDPHGRVILTNERVVLQRLVVPGGKWEGIHSHPGNQLFVHVKGGYWSGLLGGEYEYHHEFSTAGEVGWMEHIPYADGHNSGNTGNEHIDLIYVSLKGDGPIAPDMERGAQQFSNISADVVFENELMIAQRIKLKPGEWSGAHSRPGNQLYIMVTGGSLSERRGGNMTETAPIAEDGTPRWLDAVADSEEYEFGNTGYTMIEMVLITIK